MDLEREGDEEYHHPNENPEILVWSAHTCNALERSTEQLAMYLAHSTDNIADIAYTLQMEQRALPWRSFVVANTTQEAAVQLATSQREQIWQRRIPPVEADIVFLFPGSGTQQLFMAQALYQQEPVFRRVMDQCAEHVRQRWQYNILRYLYPTQNEVEQAQERLDDPAFAISALFCVEYALAQLWISWGVQPKALLGHSLGECTAAALAGVLPWHDALDLVTQCALWMTEMASGAMAIVPLPYKSIEHEMEKLDLTAINAPSLCVVSGEEEDIAILEAKLAQRAVRLKRLRTSVRPHSRLIEPMMGAIRDFATHLTLQPPRIPYISNVTGTWITPEQTTEPDYWARLLRNTVLFSRGVQTLLERPCVFVEVGPGTTLTTLVKQQGNHEHIVDVVSSLPHPHSERGNISHAIGRLWCAGVAIDWTQFHSASEKRLPLPLSPDTAGVEEQCSGVIDSTAESSAFLSVQRKVVAPKNEIERVVCDLWSMMLGVSPIGRTDDFFELGGYSLLATDLVAHLSKRFAITLKLRDLLRATTVAQLSALIAERANVKSSSTAEGQQQMNKDVTTVQGTHTRFQADRWEPFPLTTVQHAYWIGRNDAFELGNISCHGYIEFDCQDLDLHHYEQAWNHLIKRHEMLRMIVRTDGRQQILPTVPLYSIAYEDLRNRDDAHKRLNEKREHFSHQIFTPENWPLFEVCATQLDEHRTRLHISLDILMCDLTSISLLQSELARLYAYPATVLPAIDYSFREYVLNQQQLRETAAFEEDARYWRERLDQFVPPQLPLQVNPSAITQPRFERRTAKLDRERWQRLQKMATHDGITATSVVLTAFTDVLTQWNRSRRLMPNLTSFNRRNEHPDVMRLVGDFTILTLLDIDNRAERNFHERAMQVQERLWEDLDHSLFSAIDVLRELSRQGEEQQVVSMPVVFTSALGIEKILGGDATPHDWIGEQVFSCSQTPQVWLDHQVYDIDGELVLTWDSVVNLFPPGMLDDMLEVYNLYLQQLADDAFLWDVRQPQFIPTAHLQQYALVNATNAPVPQGLLHTAFLEQARQQPERVAVITTHATWNYGQLERWSASIAQQLQSRGIQSQQLIPVVMEKGVEQIIATLAILRSGAAYVPIDAGFPQERIHRLLRDIASTVVLTQPWIEHKLTWPAQMDIIPIDRQALEDQHLLLQPFTPVTIRPTDLAYSIYTSGSTGEPKGVMIEHQSALNTIVDVNTRFRLTNADCVLALSALSFDLSVWDIFGMLSLGGSIILPDPEGTRDPAHWVELLQHARVTIWNTAPALMEMLVEYLQSTAIDSLNDWANALRLVMLSGDWISLRLPDRIQALFPHTQIVSLGGATEASIWSICYPIVHVDPRWKSIPYGRPMLNQRFFVLNDALQPCPYWVTGKLYIGGIGLARGYWADPEKTAARFIQHPVTGERLYDTGDLGRYLPDGTIEFQGREDSQVKIQGHRIELEEIESALLAQPLVREAIVIATGTRFENKHLVAYVVPAGQARPLQSPNQTDDTQESVHWETLVRNSQAARLKLSEPNVDEAFLAAWHILQQMYGQTVCNALHDLGVFGSPGKHYSLDELVQQCGIHSRYKKWVNRNLHFLVDHGYLQHENGLFTCQKALPTGDPRVFWGAYQRAASRLTDPTLLALGWHKSFPLMPSQAMENLKSILTEELHSAETYLSTEAREAYRIFHSSNTVLQVLLKERVRLASERKKIRVLEIGAGFGTATAYILPILPRTLTEYIYTDISLYFLQEAQEKFAEYPFIEYRLLDIEKNPQSQGYEIQDFDIIIAVSVLHATANIGEALAHIRSLLKPHGILALLEETHFHQIFDLTMGLQQGFDRFVDTELRSSHPLLTREQWHAALKNQGFCASVVLNKPETLTDFFGFDVILAEAPAEVSPLRLGELYERLRSQLPEYMVPWRIIPLEAFPLTANGKIDRQELPLPPALGRQHGYRQPRSLVEQQLSQIWSELLKVERVGLDDNFFRLGGDSLLAVRMVGQIRTQVGVEISLQQLFAFRSLEALAAAVQAQQGSVLLLNGQAIEPDLDARYEPFPLTDLQQAYWVGLQQLYELSYASAHLYVDFETDTPDIPELEHALNRLIQHQPMLRCVMLPDGRQRILKQVPPYRIPVTTLEGLSAQEEHRAIQTLRDQMVNMGVANRTWPLFDFRVLRLDAGRSRVHLCWSLLIADGWSFYIFFHELFKLYTDSHLMLPEFDISFRDYMLAVRELEQQESYQQARAYWQKELATLPEAPQLPLARDPATITHPAMTRRELRLDVARWQALKALCVQKGVTVSAVLCTIYAEVLATWSKEPHFTLNVLYLNRLPLHPQLESLLGPFSSTIPVAVTVSLTDSFETRVRRLQTQFGEALEHGLYSGIQVLRDMAHLRGDNTRPLLPVVFTSTVGFESEYRHIPTDRVQMRDLFERVHTPQVWLDQQAIEDGDELLINWDAVEEIFPVGMLDEMFAAYEKVLHSLVEDKQAWEASDHHLLPHYQREERQLLNNCPQEVPYECMYHAISEQVRKQPQRLAVVTGQRRCTYEELEYATTNIASCLSKQEQGYGKIVAVVMEKGWEQMAAVIGIQKAAAAYLPIDPALPKTRLHYLLANAHVRVVLTQPALALEWPKDVHVITVDETFLQKPEQQQELVPEDPEALAYVIYTSGSTGQPKGVMISHRSALTTIVDINAHFHVQDSDSVLGLSALNFDLSVYDIFGLLRAGGKLVLPNPEDMRDPAAWFKLIKDEAITIWNTVPALLEMFIEYLEVNGKRDTLPLRLILLSGDWIPVNLPERIRTYMPDAQIISLGGATEASIWSIYYSIQAVDPRWRSIPYGRPLTNQSFHVLNACMQPCPTWVPGELYIGGLGVAVGYWQDQQRTAERFIIYPPTGERLYRTGDLGRYLPGGDIEFLGRIDNQVKVQGHRIELGEIEATLEHHPAVRTAVATVTGQSGATRRLIAAVVPALPVGLHEQQDALVAQLAYWLRAELPAYMCPSTLTLIDQVPLSANGKVDRRALERLERPLKETSKQYTAPRDALEEQLVELCEQLLQQQGLSVTDNLFERGANSLFTVRLLLLIERHFEQKLSAATIFRSPTIAALAHELRQQTVVRDQVDPAVLLHSGQKRTPFFCVHPSGGDVFCYLDLARLLDEQRTFIGLQDPALHGDYSSTSIQAMATRYIRALKRWQPQGPYLLGGWSLGGILSFEMACQLQREGEEIAALLMIDSNEPSMVVRQKPWHNSDPTHLLMLSYLRSQEAFLQKSLLTVTEATFLNFSIDEALVYIERCLKQHGLAHAETTAEEIRRRVETSNRHITILRSYQPTTYHGDLLLVRASEYAPCNSCIGMGVDDTFTDPYLGWGMYILGTIETIELPGHHYSLVRRPLVEQLAGVLNRYLQRSSPWQGT